MADFEEVYRQHFPAVLRAAWRAVGRRDIAEELTAEAFLALHRDGARVDLDRLPGWLITVVRNRATDYWRRQQLERRHAEAPIEAVHAPRETLADLLDVPALKPVHRACLALRYVHGMSRVEIGERLGLSEDQVRGYLHYALTLLRKAHGERR